MERLQNKCITSRKLKTESAFDNILDDKMKWFTTTPDYKITEITDEIQSI